MLLLNANTTSINLQTIIGGIIILAVIVFAIWFRLKTHPSKADKQAAEDFLNGLADNIYKMITKIINEIDLSKYDSLENLESDILKKIYDSVFDYIQSQLAEAANEDILSALVLKVLDKDTIYKFIDKLINNKDVNGQLTNLWDSNKIKEQSSDIENEDKELTEEYSDQTKYADKIDDKENLQDSLPPAEEPVLTQEELNSINPQKDEEEEYNPNDISMEIVEDDTYIDKRGRRRSKKTGRYV